MSLRLLFGTVGLAACFAGNAAMAQTGTTGNSAEASIGNLRYELVDLTPDDGETPWLSMGNYFSYASGRIGGWGEGGPSDELREDGLLELVDGLSRVSGVMSPDRLSASALSVEHDTDISTYSSVGFMFSPNTRLILMADSEIDWASPSGSYNYTYAIATLDGDVQGANGDVYSSSALMTSSGPGYQSAMLELIFRSGDIAASGNVSLSAIARAEVSPVPEPAQVSMLLAGCCAVAAVARRRRSQSG